MKIIDTDYFDGDYPDEKVIANNIKYEPFANAMCEALNQKFCNSPHSRRFYRVVPDDYILQPGFEP